MKSRLFPVPSIIGIISLSLIACTDADDSSVEADELRSSQSALTSGANTPDFGTTEENEPEPDGGTIGWDDLSDSLTTSTADDLPCLDSDNAVCGMGEKLFRSAFRWGPEEFVKAAEAVAARYRKLQQAADRADKEAFMWWDQTVSKYFRDRLIERHRRPLQEALEAALNARSKELEALEQVTEVNRNSVDFNPPSLDHRKKADLEKAERRMNLAVQMSDGAKMFAKWLKAKRNEDAAWEKIQKWKAANPPYSHANRLAYAKLEQQFEKARNAAAEAYGYYKERSSDIDTLRAGDDNPAGDFFVPWDRFEILWARYRDSRKFEGR
jgi:hypothetical protein